MKTVPPAWHYPLCIGCGVRHADDTPCPDGTRWVRASVECRICTQKWEAVVPVKLGSNRVVELECPSCGGMSGSPPETDQ